MDWMLWIVGYFAAGTVFFVVLWKAMKIKWEAEASDTKLLLIATLVVWPLVLLLVLGVLVFKR